MWGFVLAMLMTQGPAGSALGPDDVVALVSHVPAFGPASGRSALAVRHVLRAPTSVQSADTWLAEVQWQEGGKRRGAIASIVSPTSAAAMKNQTWMAQRGTFGPAKIQEDMTWAQVQERFTADIA